jgi:hypothetical protein
VGYHYNCDDNDAMVTVGSNAAHLEYGGVIQADDGYGGSNHLFSIPGKTACYHVHFNGTGRKVNVLRYKSSSTDQGTNLIKWTDSGGTGTERKNCKELASACGRAYPNHLKLLSNLHEAVNR